MISNPLVHAGPLHLSGNLLVLLACWPALSAALGGYRAAALLMATGWASNTITATLTAANPVTLVDGPWTAFRIQKIGTTGAATVKAVL